MGLLGLFKSRPFEWVLYEFDSQPGLPPQPADYAIEVIGPEYPITPAQKAYMKHHLSSLHMRYMLHWAGGGKSNWLFLVRVRDRYASYLFVTPAKRYAKVFPLMAAPKSLLIGFGFTEPEFRGKGFFTAVVRYSVAFLSQKGYGPFYGHTDLANLSIRGMEKVGFKRVGVWRGHRTVFNLRVAAKRFSD